MGSSAPTSSNSSFWATLPSALWRLGGSRGASGWSRGWIHQLRSSDRILVCRACYYSTQNQRRRCHFRQTAFLRSIANFGWQFLWAWNAWAPSKGVAGSWKRSTLGRPTRRRDNALASATHPHFGMAVDVSPLILLYPFHFRFCHSILLSGTIWVSAERAVWTASKILHRETSQRSCPGHIEAAHWVASCRLGLWAPKTSHLPIYTWRTPRAVAHIPNLQIHRYSNELWASRISLAHLLAKNRFWEQRIPRWCHEFGPANSQRREVLEP